MPDAPRSASYQPRVRDLRRMEHPWEWLRDHDLHYPSNAESLPILLRTGSGSENALSLGNRLLAENDGLTGMSRAGFGGLCQVQGLGEARIGQLMAERACRKRRHFS